MNYSFLPSHAQHMRQSGFASNLAAALQAPERAMAGAATAARHPPFKTNFTNSVHAASQSKPYRIVYITQFQGSDKVDCG
jgi:hypothetical protein